MSIVLFALIGAAIDAGAWYWICYGLFCFGNVWRVVKGVVDEWC